ncbi:hypothetical protein Scep_028899 [Stephania cephalantha]|uniref:Cystatin domain-containing protein n=1 Tax=Stephania cephalantha TaxID=152367 RepID=A0AAP0HM87_9MAGN
MLLLFIFSCYDELLRIACYYDPRRVITALAIYCSIPCVCVVVVVVDAQWTGKWTPVDPKSAHVVEMAKFAIDAHNKQAHTDLKLVGVLKAETQVVFGDNYRMTLEAMDGAGGGGAAKKYEAIVWEKAWEKFLGLIAFRKTWD